MTNLPQAAPAAAAADAAPMRLLVVVDESAAGLHTAAVAVAMAARLHADLLFQIAVPIEPIHSNALTSGESALAVHREVCRARTLPRFAQVMALAQAANVPSQTLLTLDEDPGGAVLRVLTETACALVVVGSRGRGPLSQFIHGSLAADLTRLAPCPVVVCRSDMAFGPVAAEAG